MFIFPIAGWYTRIMDSHDYLRGVHCPHSLLSLLPLVPLRGPPTTRPSTLHVIDTYGGDQRRQVYVGTSNNGHWKLSLSSSLIPLYLFSFSRTRCCNNNSILLATCFGIVPFSFNANGTIGSTVSSEIVNLTACNPLLV